MAVTASPRLGITRWSDPADPFTRAQLDGDHSKLESLGAIDATGVLSARPAAGIRGRYYFATDNGELYRDTGTSWLIVGGGKGVLGYQNKTTNQTGLTGRTDIAGLAVTVTVEAARRIRVTGSILWSIDTANKGMLLSVQEGATALSETYLLASVSGISQGLVTTTILTPLAGSHTYKLTAGPFLGGTADVQANGTSHAYILVEDIGLA